MFPQYGNGQAVALSNVLHRKKLDTNITLMFEAYCRLVLQAYYAH